MSLRIEDLSHTYPNPTAGDAPRKVLDIPAWSLPDGTQVLLRGVSGSGKTTLFNILSGLLHPTTGTVYYGDRSLYALGEEARDRFRARNIGYVFQNHLLLTSLTALENVVMPLAFARDLPRGQWRQTARELLGKVGLADYVNYRPAQLSTGQRLRVSIARALVNQPRVVLADEPTAALDAESAVAAMDLIQQTCRDNNAILIVASHDPALVERFTTIADLHAGQLSSEDTTTPETTNEEVVTI